jgi:hypothetical protein
MALRYVQIVVFIRDNIETLLLRYVLVFSGNILKLLYILCLLIQFLSAFKKSTTGDVIEK